MSDTAIIRLSAPLLTGLTVSSAQTESQLNALTTATVAGTSCAPLTLDSALATHLTATINNADYDGLIAGAYSFRRPVTLTAISLCYVRGCGG